jgi:hypothetical protein
MAPWGAVAAVVVGIAPGLLVFSAGITGRFSAPRVASAPEASELTPPHPGEKRMTSAPRT